MRGGSAWRLESFAPARQGTAERARSWLELATDTVYGPQWTHPHPCYAPGERLVAFTSDRSGRPQIFVAVL